jgi:hypothetical protein
MCPWFCSGGFESKKKSVEFVYFLTIYRVGIALESWYCNTSVSKERDSQSHCRTLDV